MKPFALTYSPSRLLSMPLPLGSQTNTWDFRRSNKEEGNTGFYFVRSNERTIKLWKDAYEAVPKFPGLDDQAVFWRVIRQSLDPPVEPLGDCRDYRQRNRLLRENLNFERRMTSRAKSPLVTCVLDPCVFSSGMLSRVWVPEYTYEALLENLDKRNETFCAVHANYLSGNKPKQQRMAEYGFWLATQRRNRGKFHDAETWGGACKEYVQRNVTL